MKKRSIKAIAAFLSFLLVISLLPSTGRTVAAGAKPKLAKKAVSIVIGGTAKIKVRNVPRGAKITYRSAKKKIAIVSKKGKVTGVRSGTAKITVFIKNDSKVKKLTYRVTVKQPKLSKSRLSLILGETEKLSIKNKSKRAKYIWVSNNPTVAAVSRNGKVEAKSIGAATIKVTVRTGKKTYRLSCNVAVRSNHSEKACIVRFISNGGSSIPSQTVKKNGFAKRPADPSRDGYTFDGWYTEADGGQIFDFDMAITADMTLYAHWIRNNSHDESYSVNFYRNDGTDTLYETVSVVSGKSIDAPDNPFRAGYIFGGWFYDENCTQKAAFPLMVTSSINLYANWAESVGDNLNDGRIDLGDLQDMVENGNDNGNYPIDVIYGENGAVSVIEGNFTKGRIDQEKINSIEDAASVLDASADLFGGSERFSASNGAITAQSVNASEKRGRDSHESAETFYRFTPEINGIPVMGSQIIISTKNEGEVTGLFSTYDARVSDVYTDSAITEGDAGSIVASDILASEEVQNYLEALSSCEENAGEAAKTREDLEKDFLSNLRISAQKVIYAASANAPALMYEINATNLDARKPVEQGTSSGVPQNKIPKDFDCNSETSEKADDSERGDSKAESPIPSVNIAVTYYVYADYEKAGNIHSKIRRNMNWSPVYLKATDKKFKSRTFNGQEESGTYRLKDTVRNIETYRTATSSTGHLWWKETKYILPGELAHSGFMSTIRRDAVSLHANMSDVYDYYGSVLGRESYDGKGAVIQASYDYGNHFENAYWSSDGQQFVFGNGQAYVAALDIVGHEFTHAIIENAVPGGGLTYYGESGALNESYADIMGTLIERKHGTSGANWTIGEDVGHTMRDMSNPKAYDQPDNYSAVGSDEWNEKLNLYVDRDDEGVHVYSGIFNLAAQKMMSDSRTAGIANERWATVFYRSLFRLTSDSVFLNARRAVLCSANQIGFTSEQQQAIKDAFDDVGIKETESIRIVLTWGETPSDLDSHLVGPGIVDPEDRFHIYFESKSYYFDGSYDSNNELSVADLDYDDITSFGPEITTIHRLTPGRYYFFVHDYTNGNSATSKELAYSGATVKVYKGTGNTPWQTYKIDRSSMGTYWNVFKLEIGSDGQLSSAAISELKTFGSESAY